MAKTVAAPFPEEFYIDPYGVNRYVVQEKTLFEWQSPSKVDRERTRKELAQLVLMVGLVFAILLLLQEVLLAIVFAAMAGTYLLFMNTKSYMIRCQVTTLGIKVEDKYYYWPDLTQFWFEERKGAQFLYFRSLFPVVQKNKFIVFAHDLDVLRTTIGTYLLYKKPQPTQWEKVLAAVKQKFPLDLEFLEI